MACWEFGIQEDFQFQQVWTLEFGPTGWPAGRVGLLSDFPVDPLNKALWAGMAGRKYHQSQFDSFCLIGPILLTCFIGPIGPSAAAAVRNSHVRTPRTDAADPIPPSRDAVTRMSPAGDDPTRRSLPWKRAETAVVFVSHPVPLLS